MLNYPYVKGGNMTKLYIISGFLGAGKTTFIDKMITFSFQGKKIVLIENDFGEVSADADLLASRGINVAELNSGCICCSLTGDFETCINDIQEKHNPDIIIIEPSGIAKPSQILNATQHLDYISDTYIITIIDIKNYKKHYDNFGELFDDQIKSASVIYLSRSDIYSDRLDEAVSLTRELVKCPIYCSDIEGLNIENILTELKPHVASDKHTCCCGHSHHEEHEHCEHHHENHKHDIDGDFVTMTLYPTRLYTIAELGRLINDLSSFNGIIRLKGFLGTHSGTVNLQGLDGNVSFLPSIVKKAYLTIIGKDFDKKDLEKLWSKYA